jgi:hypothetical protein
MAIRPRCRSVNNIIMYLTDIGWGGMDWIGVAQDKDQWRPHVKTVMNFWVA